MSVVQHIKEMISSSAVENADAWAERWFSGELQITASEVARSVIAVAGGELDRLTPETRFIEDMALNELQRVQLVLAVEQQAHIEILDEDAKGIETMAQLVGCVYAKTHGAELVKAIEGK